MTAESEMPLISVVTPCLNDTAHLAEMIESFLAQDYPHKELIVQDGGSGEATIEILRRYPIRWMVSQDRGPHDAINKAIAASAGDIIVVMPANDSFVAGAFTRAVQELMGDRELVMVYGDCRITDDQGNLTRIDRPGKLDIDRLFWIHQMMLQSSYIRREAFQHVGLFDPVIKGPGDTDWVMRAVAAYPSESFRYVPEVWSAFRLGKNKSSRGNCNENAKVLLAAHQRFLSDGGNIKRLRLGEARAQAGMHSQCASWLSRAGKRREAWQHLGEAIRHWPGLLLNSFGLKYALRTLFGSNLEGFISKFKTRVRATLSFRSAPQV